MKGSVRRAPRVVISIYDDFENPHYAGGGPRVVRTVAELLDEQYRVLVVTAGTRYGRTRRGRLEHLILPVARFSPRFSQVVWGLVLPVVALLVRHDLWIESFTPPFSSNLVPLATRRPVVGLAQALSGREVSRRYRTSVPLRVERWLLRLYRDVVVLNPRDAAAVHEVSSRIRVHLLPNAVERPPRAPSDPADGRCALFLGRIDVTQKGLDLLLAAYAADHRDAQATGGGHRLMPLVLAGGGRPEEEDVLAGLLREAGPRVTWRGPVCGAEKEELLSSCAFLVVPSREESFCLSALEAMARSRPVVRFDLPQLEWIPDGAGPVVPSFDGDALREALERLSTDADLRRRAGRTAAQAAGPYVGRDKLDGYRHLVARLLDQRAAA